jgi:hypothetical protein
MVVVMSCAHIVVWCGVVLLCWSWWHCRHDGGSPAVPCDVVSIVAFIIASYSPRAAVPELVAAPRSLMAWLVLGSWWPQSRL